MYNIKVSAFDDSGLCELTCSDYIINEGSKNVSCETLRKVRKDFLEGFIPLSDDDAEFVADCIDYEYFNRVSESDLVDGRSDAQKVADSARSLASSVGRTRSKIRQLAVAVRWEYFVTLTFDKKYVDRYSYDDCLALVQRWSRKMSASGADWLLVPEYHKDKAIHFHGLVRGLSGVVACGSKKSKKYFAVKGWNYGYSNLSPIKDSLRVANYICKYITKDLISVSKGRRRFLSSHGLGDSVRVCKGFVGSCDMGILLDMLSFGFYVKHYELTNISIDKTYNLYKCYVPIDVLRDLLYLIGLDDMVI